MSLPATTSTDSQGPQDPRGPPSFEELQSLMAPPEVSEFTFVKVIDLTANEVFSEGGDSEMCKSIARVYLNPNSTFSNAHAYQGEVRHRNVSGHEVSLFYVGLSPESFTFQFKDMEENIDLIANKGIGHAIQLRAGPHELLIFFSKVGNARWPHYTWDKESQQLVKKPGY